MSITIDADINLLCRLFHINYLKLSNEYQGMSVEEIMKAEAAQGNTAAANYSTEILSNPRKLIELFKLTDAGNKYAILNNMNEHDLNELLPLLKQQDLIQGLNFFTKDKLLKLVEGLPKEQLVKFVFEMFSQEQVMQFLPEKQVDKMLTCTDMDMEQAKRQLASVKPQVLAFMLESVMGKSIEELQNGAGGPTKELSDLTGVKDGRPMISSYDMQGKPNYDGAAIYEQLINLPDDKFQDALLAMPKQNKRDFVMNLAKQNPKLYLAVDSHAYTEMVHQRKDKDDIIRSANVISQDQLVKMITKLPKDLTAVVLTQIDTNKFADKLLAGFKNILRELVAG